MKPQTCTLNVRAQFFRDEQTQMQFTFYARIKPSLRHVTWTTSLILTSWWMLLQCLSVSHYNFVKLLFYSFRCTTQSFSLLCLAWSPCWCLQELKAGLFKSIYKCCKSGKARCFNSGANVADKQTREQGCT